MPGIQPAPATPEQGNPYLPPGPPPMLCEEFMGINTSTSRYGVDPKQVFWCDGLMPLGPKLLRTMPDVGAKIWTAPAAAQITFFDFANIGANPIMIGFQNDGSVWQINTNTKIATNILPPGTIKNPNQTTMGITQWGSQYVIIVANQTNGYWLWDGTTAYTAGSIGPVVTITAGGSNYSNPVITVTGGSGSGIALSATLANGAISKITVTNPGTNYVATDTLTVVITDSTGSGATATVTLMPFGIQGTGVETYAGRVWIINGALLTFSAPGSVTVFATSAGGGQTISVDSFLRVGYTKLIQTNGFLYLIGDSSINYISGVQTAGSPPSTTFTNQNADPEVGTNWPLAIDTWSRNIVFANPFGAHVSYGAAVTKISEPLDGVYQTVPGFAGVLPSSAKHILFGKKIWILLLPIVDPVSGLVVNKLLIWNGKIWWSSPQGINLVYIQHQEINSILTAYGTDGQSVYPLFQTPSSVFTKTLQTKLWSDPAGYQLMKTAARLWMLLNFQKSSPITFKVSIDAEQATNFATYTSPTNVIVVKNASGTIIPTKNASGTVIPVVSILGGIYAFGGNKVTANGAVLGITFETNEPSLDIWSLMLQDQIAGYRG